MTWYYAIGSTRHGPVTATQLAGLARAGTIAAGDLIWREGQADWRPLRRMAGDLYAAAAGEAQGAEAGTVALMETAQCAHSGRVLPVAEMIPYGDHWIDPAHKAAFVQRLMEGSGQSPARPDLEPTDFVYVGFWWRVLGKFIDELVVNVPVTIVAFIVFAAVFGTAFANVGESEPPGGGFFLALILLYVGVFAVYFGASAFYHSWMVAKYGGTLGKLAIGSRIVMPDGTRVGGGRAFCRWLCTHLLNQFIVYLCYAAGLMLGMLILIPVGLAEGLEGSADPGKEALSMLIVMPLAIIGLVLGHFPFWMAGRDAEKRALHDRICSTRVVKKF